MFAEAALGALLGSALAVLLPDLFGGSQGWSIKLSRVFGWIKLGYVRAAGGAVFGISVSAAIGLSTSNEPHHKMTYFVWYGLAFVGLAVAIAATVMIDRRSAPSASRTDPVEPTEKLGGLSPAARRERIDNLLYPPRDDRRELGEACDMFAMKMRVFNEEQEWKRERAISRAVHEIREADPELVSRVIS